LAEEQRRKHAGETGDARKAVHDADDQEHTEANIEYNGQNLFLLSLPKEKKKNKKSEYKIQCS
jgi:hypothetical protein